MTAKRIVVCLDVSNGRTVKGTNFVHLRDAGDPVELAERYSSDGADELVFLDIGATAEQRSTAVEMARRVAETVSIPFTIGGGITSPADIERLLLAGADKVSLNSAAVRNPTLVEEAAKIFGSQAIVVAIDGKNTPLGWKVTTHGGRNITSLDIFDWARQADSRGAGEILFTSIENDGIGTGFALEATARMARTVSIPVIASGGAGAPHHFTEVFLHGHADAALAAGIFHFGRVSIAEVKQELQRSGIPIRP